MGTTHDMATMANSMGAHDYNFMQPHPQSPLVFHCCIENLREPGDKANYHRCKNNRRVVANFHTGWTSNF